MGTFGHRLDLSDKQKRYRAGDWSLKSQHSVKPGSKWNEIFGAPYWRSLWDAGKIRAVDACNSRGPSSKAQQHRERINWKIRL